LVDVLGDFEVLGSESESEGGWEERLREWGGGDVGTELRPLEPSLLRGLLLSCDFFLWPPKVEWVASLGQLADDTEALSALSLLSPRSAPRSCLLFGGFRPKAEAEVESPWSAPSLLSSFFIFRTLDGE
jgi:hypothetical protein